MKKFSSRFIALILIIILTVTASACGTKAGTNGAATTETPVNSTAAATAAPNADSLAALQNGAKQEGALVSVGMPDDWANWKDTWNEISTKYSVKHTDTDMSSAEELAKFDSEKSKPTADIGDVGMAFTAVAVAKDVALPYKTTTWDKVPDWAKDKDGKWVVGYQGTIAFITNTKLVKNPPKSWDDIAKGNYKVAIGDVSKASQAQNAILAAAIAYGGNEANIQPGIDFFAKLSKQKRISSSDVKLANFEKGEIEVAIVWDFNALGYRQQLNAADYQVSIPTEGSVVGAYATIINKYAPHPNAAKLAREYILSDAGQINLAKGFARPIRADVKLPADVASKLIPLEQYKNAKTIQDFKVWDTTSKALPQLWQEQVLVNMN
jgi:putative spermidine/putrescine transport system substrate-binding protein